MENRGNSVHLLQNCDLPPPTKFIFPPQTSKTNGESVLIRALKLSEMRAEEAERRILLCMKEKSKMATLLLEESMRVSAYNHLVKFHEREIGLLKKRLITGEKEEEDKESLINLGEIYWWSVCFCLGFFGLGIILGRKLR